MFSPLPLLPYERIFWTYAFAGGVGLFAYIVWDVPLVYPVIWCVPAGLLAGGIAVAATRAFGFEVLGRIVGTYLLTASLSGLGVAAFIALSDSGGGADVSVLLLGALLGPLVGSPVLLGFVPTALVLEWLLLHPDETPAAP